MFDPTDSARPRLLCVVTCMPGPSFSGLAMRAWATIYALTETWAVTLLIHDHKLTPIATLDTALAKRCARVHIFHKDADLAELRAAVAGEEFAVVHLFRAAAFSTWRGIAPVLAGSPQRWLDMDDVESASNARMHVINKSGGRAVPRRNHEREALLAGQLEREIVDAMDRVFVCSAIDLPKLPAGRAVIDLLPNVRVPPERPSSPPAGDPFTLLMIGSMSYLPNEDGLGWLVTEIFPRARAMAPRPLRLLVAGHGRPGPALSAVIDGDPDIESVGFNRDLSDAYARAHVALVPIRAGGGTRIKALEAWTYRRPVVGTSIGLEGLDVTPGQEALIADEPWAFAEAIVALATDPALCERIAAAGYAHWQAHYTIDAIVPILAPGSFTPR
jgi:glycosyltransferase involved in cell wall biosynthesis